MLDRSYREENYWLALIEVPCPWWGWWNAEDGFRWRCWTYTWWGFLQCSCDRVLFGELFCLILTGKFIFINHLYLSIKEKRNRKEWLTKEKNVFSCFCSVRFRWPNHAIAKVRNLKSCDLLFSIFYIYIYFLGCSFFFFVVFVFVHVWWRLVGGVENLCPWFRV